MRSSSGDYYIGLDHVRALAAFLVFSWHFIHAGNGRLIPFAYVPSLFPFSLVDEGHTGVALFMTLSGYLFAKLLDSKNIKPAAFIWNRILRLFPLLVIVIVMVGLLEYRAGRSLSRYAERILMGAFLPTLPNGGWSITIEFHFYVILPMLLWLSRKSRFALLCVEGALLIIRYILYRKTGEIQTMAFWTIIGRLDQFVFGITAYHFRSIISGNHRFAVFSLIAFSVFYWYFDYQGGFYCGPSYPSHRLIWVFLPAVEGLAYAVLISWYDNTFRHSNHFFSKWLARIGTYSYSIYLLHFFIVFTMAEFIHTRLLPLSNFYLAVGAAAVCFLMMIPVGALSYRFIETPFLQLRKQYILDG
ncbi:MAG: acyltransferase family protein [Thermodesulfobacteriota bacterium]